MGIIIDSSAIQSVFNGFNTFEDNSALVVTDQAFKDDTLLQGIVGGGALFLLNSDVKFESNCQFKNNHAASYGGALLIGEQSNVEIDSGVFTENTADEGGDDIYIMSLNSLESCSYLKLSTSKSECCSSIEADNGEVSSDTCENANINLDIYHYVFLSIMLAFIFICILLLFLKQRRYQAVQKQEYEKGLDLVMLQKVQRNKNDSLLQELFFESVEVSDPQLIIRGDEITFQKIISNEAILCHRQNNMKVMAKVVNVKIVGTNTFITKKELHNLNALSNPNIANFYGICNKHDSFLIQEYCATTLYDFILEKPLTKKTYSDTKQYDLLKILLQITKGLKFLHSKGIPHKNLKPSNILLGKNHVPKLVDIGVSIFWLEDASKQLDDQIYDEEKKSEKISSVYYQAPEVTGIITQLLSAKQRKAGDNQSTRKLNFQEVSIASENGENSAFASLLNNLNSSLCSADIFSLACIMYFMWSRQHPYGDLPPFEVDSRFKRASRPQIPKSAPEKLEELLTSMWGTKPHFRTKLDAGVTILNSIITNYGPAGSNTNFNFWKRSQSPVSEGTKVDNPTIKEIDDIAI